MSSAGSIASIAEAFAQTIVTKISVQGLGSENGGGVTTQRTKLSDIQFISAAAGNLYANPGGTKSYIKGFIIHNLNSTVETVKIYNVPDSSGSLGTAGDTNIFINISVAANETVLIDFPYVIVLTDTNDSIQGSTTTASKVTFQILGDKE